MLSPSQLQTVYGFMIAYDLNPRIRVKQLHRQYSTYSAISSTKDLLQKARDTQVLIGPRIFLNAHLDVELYNREDINVENTIDRWNDVISDRSVRYAIMLAGGHSLLVFKRGATLLTYAEAIRPSFPAIKEFEEINPEKIGKIQPDPYPKNWTELDWKVYEYMKHLTFSYRLVGKKLDVSWQTVKNHFEKIVKDCKTWNSFFPRGLLNYYHVFMSFTTDYELDLRNELKKIDRTSFLYRFGETVLLYAALDNYKGIRKFYSLEKKGIIHDLRVSTPIHWCKPDVIL